MLKALRAAISRWAYRSHLAQLQRRIRRAQIEMETIDTMLGTLPARRRVLQAHCFADEMALKGITKEYEAACQRRSTQMETAQ